MAHHKRSFTEAQKKIIAARQRWACSACGETLSAAYQVDHTVPLWAGGADDADNATALCANCHAVKTQSEAVERAKRRRDAEIEKAERAKREKEKKEKLAFLALQVDLGNGKKRCGKCETEYYAMFGHVCKPRVKKPPELLFEEYRFTR